RPVDYGQGNIFHAGEYGQQQAQRPHQGTHRQTGDNPAPVAPAPEYNGKGAGQELQGFDKGDHGQIRQAEAVIQNPVEQIGAEENGRNQYASQPDQLAVEVGAGAQFQAGQQPVVHHHGRKRERDNYQRPGSG